MKNELHRIAVVGTCCSGKTFFAQSISEILGITHIELDSFYWKLNWELSEDKEFRIKTYQVVCNKKWVIDGNGSKVRDIIWNTATTIIWLNYPFYIVFIRAFYRTLRRLIFHKKLASGNYETLKHIFFSKNSAVYYVIKTFHIRRHELSLLFNNSEYKNIDLIEFKHPKQAKNFLKNLRSNNENIKK